jgi:predicted  nucleic acid-binding Zn-ribbon protein
MRMQTWLNFKNKKRENLKKIKSLRRTIYNNICDSVKEKVDLKTEVSNLKYELNAVHNGETGKEF